VVWWRGDGEVGEGVLRGGAAGLRMTFTIYAN